MFTGMSKSVSNQAGQGAVLSERSLLAVRIPRKLLRTFKICCIRSGMTMQDGAVQALTAWISQQTDGESLDA